ncbi:MAG: histidine phosphatase family protein [Propionibacteriaceae bacterium]|jgi:2,3-bisphosphoglycerate-dependent phosphoglycerate mutase|nr:histidine phosphatase family protein [Propionibacteriaceae bacterium]
MRLIIIRHGQSANNKHTAKGGGGFNRWPDPKLTKRGRLQARRLADHWPKVDAPAPDVVYTSLMLRAVETAAPLAAGLGLPVLGHLRMHEVGGVFDGEFLDCDRGPEPDARPARGHSAGELLEACPGLVLPDGVTEDGWYSKGIEWPAQGWRRAQDLVAELRDRHGPTDDTVVVVAHNWFAQYLMRAILDWPPGPGGAFTRWLDLNNTGHIQLWLPGDPADPDVTVNWVNRTDHLTAKLLTH